MENQRADTAPSLLSADERAAVRAYLQRGEVRLSTVHRVATALLSGAGLMVLLPVVGRDAVVDVARHLLSGSFGLDRVLLGLATLGAWTVPVLSLLLMLRELTGFYFHANHISGTFAPRFTLTGLRLPRDELGPAASKALDRERARVRAVELVVADNEPARAEIDERIAAYGGLGVVPPEPDERLEEEPDGAAPEARNPDSMASPADLRRAQGLLALAASQPRDLLDEVAKVEHGMVRNVLGIQVIVLRYVKALLALLTTALAVFASAAVVEGKVELTAIEHAWMAGVLVVWAPAVIWAVSAPVRWLDHLLRSEEAAHSAVAEDRSLTQIEDITVRIAVASFVAALVVLALALTGSEVSSTARVVGSAVGFVGVVTMAATLRSWARGAVRRKVLGR